MTLEAVRETVSPPTLPAPTVPAPTVIPTVGPMPDPTPEPPEPPEPAGTVPVRLSAAGPLLSAWPGEAVTLTLALETRGDVAEVTVAGVLPEGLLFDTFPNHDGEHVAETRRVSWAVGSLNREAERTLQLRCLIGEDAPDLMTATFGVTGGGVRGRATTEVEITRLYAPTESDVTSEDGGELRSGDGRVVVRFPRGAVNRATRVEHRAVEARRLQIDGTGMALRFELNAWRRGRREQEPTRRFGQSLELWVDLDGLVDLDHLARHQVPYLAY